jgi:hypothetical protein
MKNLTTPRAILIGSLAIASAILFRVDGTSFMLEEAKAEVAGMTYSELRQDRDFKKAVAYIVESCSLSGYVAGDSLNGVSISC